MRKSGEGTKEARTMGRGKGARGENDGGRERSKRWERGEREGGREMRTRGRERSKGWERGERDGGED